MLWPLLIVRKLDQRNGISWPEVAILPLVLIAVTAAQHFVIAWAIRHEIRRAEKRLRKQGFDVNPHKLSAAT